MLVSWEREAGLHSDDEANDTRDVFQVLLADFWEALGLLFMRYADSEDADPQALEGVATLLQVSLVWGISGSDMHGYSGSTWLSDPLVSF